MTSSGCGADVVAGYYVDLNDMWIYSTSSSVWSDISAGMTGSVPSPRQCLLSEVGGLLYVFGGYGECLCRMGFDRLMLVLG